MDWSKAKNILIVAFIITNIFLIVNIEKNIFSNESVPTLKDKYIEDVLKILEGKNIHVEGEIPKTLLTLPVLDVEYETYDDEKMTKLFREKYKAFDGSIEVSNDKLLIYKGEGTENDDVIIEPEKVQDVAEGFIRSLGFMKGDVQYWHTQVIGQSYEIIYKQIYKGTFLEDSYMKVILGLDGSVQEFHRVWLKPGKYGEHKSEIMPSTKALLKAIEKIDSTGGTRIIKDIRLGYRFDAPNWKTVKSGRAFPVWRIVLDDQTTIFIEAYENY